MALTLYPLNDFVQEVTLKNIDSNGTETLETTGPVTAFLAISNLPTAVAADVSLEVSATYTGAGGVWIIRMSGQDLTYALLDGLFGGVGVNTYLIVQKITITGAIRVYTPVTYTKSRATA